MSNFNHAGRWSVVFTGVVCLCATLSLAQPSLLPPGPPFTTSGRFGPRTEIGTLPYFIFAPGSYYLSNTLIQTVPGPGISIGASDVTIDLNGHALIGGGFPGDTAIAVAPLPLQNISIFNGSVAFWGGPGINLVGVPGPSQIVRLEDLTSYSNGGTGISVPPLSIVRNVIASYNFGWGLQASDYTKITNVVAVDNDFDGIFTGFGCHVSDCVASFNGFDGFALGTTNVTIGSTAVSNGANGFEVGFNNRVTDCSASNNGFMAGFGDGFFCLGFGSILGGCAANNNANSGFDGSPGMPTGSSVHHCIATFNGTMPAPPPFGGDGFTNFASVSDCTADSNTENGIQCGIGSHVHRNVCRSNGGAGILATGDGNTIQHNHVAFNTAAGINTVAFNPGPGGNLIKSNTAHWNLAVAVLPDDFAFGPFDVFGGILGPAPGLPLPAAADVLNISYP